MKREARLGESDGRLFEGMELASHRYYYYYYYYYFYSYSYFYSYYSTDYYSVVLWFLCTTHREHSLMKFYSSINLY